MYKWSGDFEWTEKMNQGSEWTEKVNQDADWTEKMNRDSDWAKKWTGILNEPEKWTSILNEPKKWTRILNENESGLLLNFLPLHASRPLNTHLRTGHASSCTGQPHDLLIINYLLLNLCFEWSSTFVYGFDVSSIVNSFFELFSSYVSFFFNEV